jgi:hypothetical protein
MTRQEWCELIARTLEAMPSHAASLRAPRIATAHAFADALAKEFPDFDATRFLVACNLNKGMPN